MSGPSMRIALLAEWFAVGRGGTQVYNQEFAQRLAERGHDVRVLSWEAPTRDPGRAYGLEVARLERRGRALEPHGLRESLRSWRPGVAMLSGANSDLRKIARTTSWRVPTLVAVHDLRDRGPGLGRAGRLRARWRYGWAAVRRFAANSEDTRGRLLRLGVPARKVDVVHPGVDTDRFTPDPAQGAALRRKLGLGERPMLLTVARVAANKAHARVIETLPGLLGRHPDLLYAIVGPGTDLRARLEARVAELGIGHAVHFAGEVADVLPWYRACDVFVMVSRPSGGGLRAGEGFGIAYLEAGACAKPCVASSSGGGGEIVVDGETGRVVGPEDDRALAGAIGEILADPARARAWGEKARERVRRFDWREGTDALERSLRRASSGWNPQRGWERIRRGR